ncbi:uncharacterized protein SAPINGB_P003334 [Magnusiomyces paraingens]|uniref:Ribosome-releasing factor 2, mitochondrial n=1 Tax=Magnusiomyces paraingens TaxID=2606893 RepID=A0A5E8BPW3_9ASCO|nr:uncharacterized protein SAPINGB_P003334 [Saprochaete ingens]VVT52961.1 unnamed protein product [Saprochaete ingens]
MLYYSGLTDRIGDVDQGDTVMDYLPAERDRGITITSAAITFHWRDHKINLIDTPGHADFTFEVIRSLRVLDGAVTILDGVAGVEAQTEKVWKQASEMEIPRIVYVNKMDRESAGFGRTVKEIVSKLNTQVAIINFPFFENGKVNSEGKFQGIVDVIEKKIIKWSEGSDGKNIQVLDITEYNEVALECEKARTALIETLTELDDNLVEHYLEIGSYMDVSPNEIKKALRKACLNKKIVPVLCGASFKNIGVQPLLEAVIDYLPSPIERPPPKAITLNQNKNAKKTATPYETQITIDPSNKNLTSALAFKVVHDNKKGMMVYVRVYSGTLHHNSIVLNSTTGKRERIMKLYQMHANLPIETTSIEAGNIGVIVGTKEIRTGDTIVAHGLKRDGVKSLSKAESHLQLHPIKIPPPVFFSSIDPLTLADTKNMEEALVVLLTEDPSLHVMYDEDSGQTMLSGMGELHLEIAKDRLVKDLKAKVEVGKIMVSYKETIIDSTKTCTQLATLSTQTDETGPSTATVSLLVEPADSDISLGAEIISRDNIYVSYPEHLPENFLIPSKDILRSVNRGIVPGIAKGGLKSHLPLHSLHVKVSNISIPPDITNPSAISLATRLAIEEALQSIKVESYCILEPIMDVKVMVAEEDVGTVVNDLSSNRRGSIISLKDSEDFFQENTNDINYRDLANSIYTPPDFTMYMSKHGDRARSSQSIIKAQVPLEQMIGYLNYLRSLTKGRGTFTMDFHSYQKAPTTVDFNR